MQRLKLDINWSDVLLRSIHLKHVWLQWHHVPSIPTFPPQSMGSAISSDWIIIDSFPSCDVSPAPARWVRFCRTKTTGVRRAAAESFLWWVTPKTPAESWMLYNLFELVYLPDCFLFFYQLTKRDARQISLVSTFPKQLKHSKKRWKDQLKGKPMNNRYGQ